MRGLPPLAPIARSMDVVGNAYLQPTLPYCSRGYACKVIARAPEKLRRHRFEAHDGETGAGGVRCDGCLLEASFEGLGGKLGGMEGIGGIKGSLAPAPGQVSYLPW